MFDIGFLPITIWDFVDVFIVGYLIFRIYKLLSGSIAFNILLGIIFLYMTSWLVGALKMDMLNTILTQLKELGIIIIIIIFQPEVRRFLLLVGNTTLKGRSGFFTKILARDQHNREQHQIHIEAIKGAILKMSRLKLGALIVLADRLNFGTYAHSGTLMNAEISKQLLESIFQKNSPLHDGALLIAEDRIQAAGCILPVSKSIKIPKSAGLRHRAAVGVTEETSMSAFIVSEETGNISFAKDGKLIRKISESKLSNLLMENYSSQ
ncbi:MAG: diadenylate cyclase CdaA [Bacteroidota bacterium]